MRCKYWQLYVVVFVKNNFLSFNMLSFDYRSDGFSTDDLVFYWKEMDSTSAIRVNEDLQMPDFVLTSYETQYCNRTTITGQLSISFLDFTVKK